MTKEISNNKRIAKNTLMLYVRMLLTMAVSLYTSRVVLDVLGVEDYGIYNVVGGVVAMFSFLNASMGGATSRFITFEIGKQDDNKVKEVFSSALTIHIIIALIVLLLGETIGLWFLENKLVIPENRMFSARIIYQLSLISVILSITQVPYNAMILSYEKMNVYAYVEILNSILRLSVVFLISFSNSFDKLILYAVLILSVSALIMLIYRGYSMRTFPTCRYTFRWDWAKIKPMLAFSGWDLYGNASVVARTQGVNMLLNIFFGPALNAASGIATQVQGAVMSFAGNILAAFRPQIVKSYAQKEYKRTIELVENAAKLSFILLLILSLPIIVEMPFILSIWLKDVPEYTVIFCRLTLAFNFFANLSSVVISAIHATGKIKRPSLINGTLYLSVIPISYVAYKMGIDPWISYAINVFMVLLGFLSNVYTLKLYLKGFYFFSFIRSVFAPCLLVFAIAISVLYLSSGICNNDWLQLFLTTLLSTVIILSSSYIILLNEEMKNNIKAKIKIKLQ